MCPRLEVLAVAGNCLGDDGASGIATLLRSGACPNLKSLDLRKNFIGQRGFTNIFKALSVQVSVCPLEVLCFGCNLISDTVVETFTRLLAERKFMQLKFLGIEDNFIQEQGVTLLANVLKLNVCPKLRELCIGNNSIENARIHQVFTEAMMKNI